MQKALCVAWDRWQQRNDTHNHTLHPWRAAEVIESRHKEVTATCVSKRQNFPFDSESTLLNKGDHLFLQLISLATSNRRDQRLTIHMTLTHADRPRHIHTTGDK
jgi:hypothetical protein